jgi:hypothetical protein
VTDAEAVLAAARERARSLVAGDATRLASLLHPQLRWTTFRGDVLDRDRYVAGNTDGSLRWSGQTLHDVHVVVVEDTAVLTAVVVDEVDRGGEAERFRLRLTQTWVRTPDGWQCLSGHAGPRLPAEQPHVERVLVLGRGGAGKSTLARAVGSLTGIPVHELDEHFWQQGLHPLRPEQWRAVQLRLAAAPTWVMDGDLGPYDALDVRAARADTVLLLDHGFLTCAWRAARRGRERRDFWSWVWHYRRRYLPAVLETLRVHAPGATVHRLRSPRATRAFLRELEAQGRGRPGSA